jgi:hypothetical protein
LLVVTSLGTMTGCFVEAPPDLEEPKRTRPFLFDPEPAITQIVSVSSESTKTFTVGVQSEDASEDLLGLLFVNYDLPGQDLVNFDRAGASTLEDLTRRLSVMWPVNREPGCTQVTMLVTHPSNYHPATQRAIDRDDAAQTTWWVAVDGDFSNCPRNVGADQ